MKTNIERIANEIKASAKRDQIIAFLLKNPNPKDANIHKWAEDNDWDVHELEIKIYELASIAANFLGGGRSNKKKFTELDADQDQLKMGIQVEYEHTYDTGNIATMIAKRIAMDHLSESDTYYTALKKMEKSFE